MKEPWIPDADQIGAALVGWGNAIRDKVRAMNLDADDLEPIRALIRAAVEKALNEEKALMYTEYAGSTVREVEKALAEQEARHAREIETLRGAVESAFAFAGSMHSIFANPGFTDRYDDAGRCERFIKKMRAALAALEVKGE